MLILGSFDLSSHMKESGRCTYIISGIVFGKLELIATRIRLVETGYPMATNKSLGRCFFLQRCDFEKNSQKILYKQLKSTN